METPGLVAHLEKTTRDKIAIDQPGALPATVSKSSRLEQLLE